jgi:peroxiredoxin Q/BCP
VAFTGLVKRFKEHGAVVFGISPDKPETQKKFEEKHKLNVRLLADTEKKVLEKYGAFGEKKMYGKVVMGVIRSTFLIDPDGKLVRIWRKVRVDGHAEAVLEALEELSA